MSLVTYHSYLADSYLKYLPSDLLSDLRLWHFLTPENFSAFIKTGTTTIGYSKFERCFWWPDDRYLLLENLYLLAHLLVPDHRICCSADLALKRNTLEFKIKELNLISQYFIENLYPDPILQLTAQGYPFEVAQDLVK